MRLILCALLPACAVHGQGVVRPTDPLTLELPEGQELRLKLDEEVSELAHLDGLVVEYWGRKRGRTLKVTDFKVGEGDHGLPTWVGVLQARGLGIGLLDRNSEVFYMLHPDSEVELEDYLGQIVLLEGYVDGPHVVRVMHHRILAPDESDR